MTYWQVAAGEGARDYSDVFLKYGVILMGSGHRGSFLEYPERFEGHKDWRRKIVTLAKKMKPDDVVILKRGHGKNGRILAAGRITSEYEWLEPFEDVDGWDLRHGRMVEWVKPDSPILVEGLARGTISRVYKSNPRSATERLLKEGKPKEDGTSETLQPVKDISYDDLVRSLIGNGMCQTTAETLIHTIERIRRLAAWYIPQMDDVSEHEIRTFLIVPLLQALGWSEKQIKIEWAIKRGRTDVSLFREEFNKDAKPYAILESKRMGAGLNRAERQVVKYAQDCNMVVTSTGDRYWLYVKEPCQKWDARGMKEKHLSAYMNLFKLKESHPYLVGVGGAPNLLKSLMPG